ncbi:hypothetical protein V1294_004253 [Bradyrhizobium sp. AZCC 1678]
MQRGDDGPHDDVEGDKAAQCDRCICRRNHALGGDANAAESRRYPTPRRCTFLRGRGRAINLARTSRPRTSHSELRLARRFTLAGPPRSFLKGHPKRSDWTPNRAGTGYPAICYQVDVPNSVCFSALTHNPYLRPQPPSPLGPYFGWRRSCSLQRPSTCPMALASFAARKRGSLASDASLRNR